jgi:glycosyltransferase involved in cell wall biosynthesis
MVLSIVIPCYNEEKTIKTILEAVKKSPYPNKEIIIVDDCSKDDTVKVIQAFHDPRIKLHRNLQNIKHVKSFAKAISLAQHELIFLCDQDDIWVEGRIEVFEECFRKFPDVKVVTSNFFTIDDQDLEIANTLRKVSFKDSKNFHSNIYSIIKGNIGYFGCAMAFKKEIVPIILPIPTNVEAHDLWLAMAGNLLKANLHIDHETLYHRIHKSNASNISRPWIEKVNARIEFIKQYIELKKRIKKYGTRYQTMG